MEFMSNCLSVSGECPATGLVLTGEDNSQLPGWVLEAPDLPCSGAIRGES